MGECKITLLILLLDLFVIFDTSDHTNFINRLSLWHGMSGTALCWFMLILKPSH